MRGLGCFLLFPTPCVFWKKSSKNRQIAEYLGRKIMYFLQIKKSAPGGLAGQITHNYEEKGFG